MKSQVGWQLQKKATRRLVGSRKIVVLAPLDARGTLFREEVPELMPA